MYRRPVLSGTWGLLLLVPPIACSSTNDAAEASSMSGPTVQTGKESEEPTIAFLESDLQFVPGDAHGIAAVVNPPAAYEVRFSLAGDFDDAFLDQSQVLTGADGVATATLNAPSSARTFTVRASVGGKSATLPVSVGTGFSESIINQQTADRVAEIIARRQAETEIGVSLPSTLSIGKGFED